jgi:hypothetical protein
LDACNVHYADVRFGGFLDTEITDVASTPERLAAIRVMGTVRRFPGGGPADARDAGRR